MRFDTPSRPLIDTKSDKESRLLSFMADALSSSKEETHITLVARGTDSPVAHALASILTASGNAPRSIRVVLFDIDTTVEDHAKTSILDIASAEFRVLPDSRFVDAHEQLVIGDVHVWIGDCMRRDPAKRDAFEVYHLNVEAATANTSASFAKLWASAKPLKRSVTRAIAPASIVAGQATDATGDITTSRR